MPDSLFAISSTKNITKKKYYLSIDIFIFGVQYAFCQPQYTTRLFYFVGHILQ